MTGQQLKNSILQMAIQGKLVPQDPHDEPASVLLERIREEKKRLVKEGVLKKKDLEETPISEEEIPFDIPEGWEWVRLKEISRSISDGDHMPPPKATYGIPFLVISNIVKGYLDFSNTRFVPQSYFDNITPDRKAEKGDVLFTVTGSYGKAVLNHTERSFCFQRHIALVKPMIFPSFVEILLNTPYIKTECDNKATGMAQKTVGIDILRSFIVPLPPHAEQLRIAEKIDKLMPLIESYGKSQEALNALNASLPEKLRQSILQEAIQGHLVPQDPNEEPASVLLERIRAEKARLVKEGKLKKKDLEEKPISPDEIPFDIPEGWEWCRFNSLVNFEMGSTPERRNDEYWVSGNHPWISISDMKDLQTIDNSKERITDAALQKYFGNRCSPKGTLIMSFKLTIGRVSILGMDAIHNEAIISIYPYVDKDNSLRDYLLHFLRLLTSYIQTTNAIKGSTLNSSKMSQMLIPLPPLSEQRRIVTKLEEILPRLKSMNGMTDR